MKSITRMLTVGAISTMAFGSTAIAKDPSNTANKFGLGYASTLGGTTGVSARYGLGGGLALEGVFAYSNSEYTTTNKKTNGTTSGDMGVGVVFDYKPSPLRGEKVAASVTGEINYAQSKQGTISDGDESGMKYTDITAGAGMRVEFWPASWVSMNTRFGLAVSPNGEGQQAGAAYGDDSDGGDDDATYGGMDIALTGNLWGGAGVTFWF